MKRCRVRLWSQCWLWLGLWSLAAEGEIELKDKTSVSVHDTQAWRPEDQKVLQDWYRVLSERPDGESFGALVARAASYHVGRPYFVSRAKEHEEMLRVRLSTLQCVSLVESALAVAQCIWAESPTEACFLAQVQSIRYRDGQIDGYASRLHYTTDWIRNNEARQRLHGVDLGVSAPQTQFEWSYMSTHRRLYPQLRHAAILQLIRAEEERLSREPVRWLQTSQWSTEVAQRIESGDIVAIVGDKPGLFIRHLGFALRAKDGTLRLLHASSYNKRVLVTPYSIGRYLKRRSDRKGVVVVRPRPLNL